MQHESIRWPTGLPERDARPSIVHPSERVDVRTSFLPEEEQLHRDAVAAGIEPAAPPVKRKPIAIALSLLGVVSVVGTVLVARYVDEPPPVVDSAQRNAPPNAIIIERTLE